MTLIPLTNSDCCVCVSDRDGYIDIFTWRLKKSGDVYYPVTTIHYYENGKRKTFNIRIHRMIMNCWNVKFDVHHKDHNPLNCERDNLEIQDAIEHKTKHNQMVH